MHFSIHFHLALAAAAATFSMARPKESACARFAPSVVEFSSSFQQPEPPLIASEFNTSFIQHKWYILGSVGRPPQGMGLG